MVAISERSSPREMMTIPIPQLRITRAAEFDAMTRKFPKVANPWMKIENSRTSANDDADDHVFEQAGVSTPRAAGFKGMAYALMV